MNARSCKHLKSILGDAYENERVKLMNPNAAVPAAPASKSKARTNSKRKKADDDDDEKPAKKPRSTRKPASKGKQKDAGEEDEDAAAENDEEEEVDDKKANVDVLLATKWDLEKGSDPTGWWVSEKLDGVRYSTPEFFYVQ